MNQITKEQLATIIIGNGDYTTIDYSHLTDMSHMFAFHKTFNRDISNLDVSNVTNMKGMFFGCHKFNQPLDSWDVSNVQNIDNIFKECFSFNQKLYNWKLHPNVQHKNSIDTAYSYIDVFGHQNMIDKLSTLKLIRPLQSSSLKFDSIKNKVLLSKIIDDNLIL